MPTNIYSLSPELVASLAKFLDSFALFELRLSCRYLCDCSLHEFVERFFKCRTHLITQLSLDALLDISAHPKFGRSINKLNISRRYLAKYSDEMNFIRDSGLITVYMTEILRQATACRTLVIDEDFEDPWGYTDFLERNDSNTPLDETIEMRTRYSRNMCFDVGIVQAAFVAMTISKAPIHTLDLSTISLFQSNALKIPEAYTSRLLKAPWLKTLTTLKLQLDFTPPAFDIKHVVNFIHLFLHLENLLLKVHPYEDEYHDGEVLVEINKFHDLVRQLRIPRLRTLELVAVDCRPDDLMKIFDSHRHTLRQISLHEINSSIDIGASWQSLLAMLRDRLQLEKLRMYGCTVSDAPVGSSHFNVRFVCFEFDSGGSSDHVEVVGEDPWLFDRLIRGLREETPKTSYPIRVS